ncbi:hypothetical protein HDU81_000553 [Chytriomyces hyalinus]|nr:hypothetical protein HDU81_000553 [Chytriomyces hyalinus]
MANNDPNNNDYREKYIRVLEDRIHVTDRLRDEEARFSTLSADVILMHKEIIQLRAALMRFSVPHSYTPSPAHITEFSTDIIRQAMALEQPDSFNNSQLAPAVAEPYPLEAWAAQGNHGYTHMHPHQTDRNQSPNDSQNRCQIHPHQSFHSQAQLCQEQQYAHFQPPSQSQSAQYQPNSHTTSRTPQAIQPKPSKPNPRSKDASSSSATPVLPEMLPIHPSYPPGSIIPWPKLFEDAQFLKPGFTLSDNQFNSAEKLAHRFLIKNYGVERANGYQVKHVYGKRERCFGIPQEMVKEFLSVSWVSPSEYQKAGVLATQIIGPSDGSAGAIEQPPPLTQEQQIWVQQRNQQNQQQLMANRVRDEQRQLQLKQIQLQEHQKNIQDQQRQLQQHQHHLHELQEHHQPDKDSPRNQKQLQGQAAPAWLSHQLLSPEEVTAAQKREESKRQAQTYLQSFIKVRQKDPDVTTQQISEATAEFSPEDSPPPPSCTTETAPNSANPVRSASLESYFRPLMGFFPAAPNRGQLFTEFSEPRKELLAKCNRTPSESDPGGSTCLGCDEPNLQNCKPTSSDSKTEIEPKNLRMSNLFESLALNATPKAGLKQTQQQLPQQDRQLKLRLIAPMPETNAADASLSTSGEEKSEGTKSTPRRSARASSHAANEGSSRRSSGRLRKEDRSQTKDASGTVERKRKKPKLSNASSKTEKTIVYDTFHKLNQPVQGVALDKGGAPASGTESDYVHAAASAEQSAPFILSPDMKETFVKYASLISSIVPQYKDLLREKRTLVKRKVKEYLISRIGAKQLNFLTIFGAPGVPNTYGIPAIMIPDFTLWANHELREHIRTLAEEQNIL